MDNKKKTGSVRVWRRIIQVISFLVLPGLFTSIFYAMKEIYSGIFTGTFSLSAMFPQLLLFLGSMIITILTGRFFCGFLCSFGAMGDFLWYLTKKTGKKGLKVSEKVDGWLKNLKYVILMFIILGIWTFHLGNLDSMTGPWAVFGMYSKIGSLPSVRYLFTTGGLLLLLIIAGSFLIERFFCRYLCPLGAVFAILSRFRLFRIKKERSKCGSCRLCTSKCSMGIPLYQYDTVTSGECIDCFECTSVCPRHNARANGAPVAVSAVSAAAMFGLVYAGNTQAQMVSSQTPVTVQVQSNTGNYIDGTYTGTGQGFRGETKTSVTVENGNITDITVLSYEDDKPYFSKAVEKVTAEIINSQSTEVDAVSGATFSSNGIMESVANALNVSYNNPNSTLKSEGRGHHGKK
ncbi:MAG: 4Fe-4S binding protein [Paenibacillaceae bacterium]|nr:4Fe-4S binding protein [Paenibacillaceae bacterium]